MEIDQYLYDLNASGDAIVAYRMSAANGGYVEICNLSASVLSWCVPNEKGELIEIAAGRCVRGLRGLQGDDNWGGVRFEEMLWEGRVEVNRVVMSLSYESDGVGVLCEVVFDYDDDNTLEITYIASPDADYEIDFTHQLQFNSCGDIVVKSEDKDCSLYNITDAKRSILQDVATIGHIAVQSSQPAIYVDGGVVSPVGVDLNISQEERYVTKNLYRIN